ncbi:MAG: hypothetical protein F9K49_05535 [Caedimonadaceae bacterium]|nr:MAG: hypothetical protein F9K49_05535 [Caedimonadaceae bacterium]
MKQLPLFALTLALSSLTPAYSSYASENVDNWDDDFEDDTTKNSSIRQRLNLVSRLQSLDTKDTSRSSLPLPLPLDASIARREMAESKDDSHVEKVRSITWGNSAVRPKSDEDLESVDGFSFSSEDDEDEDDHSPTIKHTLPTHQLRSNQLWSHDWYTKNSARMREARELLDQGKKKAAMVYIEEAVSEEYPHALLYKCQILCEEKAPEEAQLFFNRSIIAVAAREADMDDQSVDIFLKNARVLLKNAPALSLPTILGMLDEESKVRKSLLS